MRAFFVGLALALGVTAPMHAQSQRTASSPHGAFEAPCAQCHRADAWKPVAVKKEFRHPDRFPLEAAHAKVACTTCHVRLDFTGVKPTCASCHRDFHQGELGADCASCHTTRSFLDVAQLRQRHQTTNFPLAGRHAMADCRSCHTPRAPGQQSFVNLPTVCVSCHLPDYKKASAPPHAASAFPTDCTACHTVNGWNGAKFDHNATRFALTGAHRAATCQSCHADNVFRGKPTACVSCHQQQYATAKDPPHASASFPTTCETCHSTTAWDGASFDHSKTQFPLVGAHKAVNCAQCHGDGVYTGKLSTCVSCHQTKYAATTTPSHATAGFPTTCELCHSQVSWQPASFNHSATAFPLTGAHTTTTCTQCHGDGVYKGKPTACVSCHQAKYAATTNPPHAAAGFSTACETCHNTTQWPGATFNHDATAFPLVGAHRAVNCQQCHGDGVYKGKPTTCVSCHQASYNATTNPAHAAAGFPTTCQTCHGQTAWVPSSFNHSATAFPLTGAHATTACSGCHGDGVYKGKATTCVSCHLTKYQATTTPNHASAGFPTDCASCHNTTTWLTSTWNHDAAYFPISSGNHKAPCTTCHTNASNYAVFTCLSCHTKSSTDSQHQGRTGYVYASANCYACHPRGR